MPDAIEDKLLRYAILTKELDEETGIYEDTLAHIFYGNDLDEIRGLIAAHRKYDKFFDGSWIGYFEGIRLQNEIFGLI